LSLFYKNVVLVIVCVGVLALIVSVAHGIGPSNAPDPHENQTTTRKNGDLWVGYYGGRYRSRSSRLGSTHNRRFRGGGLHGGK